MITLECNYSKKLGLPGYSSHQFSITLKTEISNVAQVQAESSRLYKILQGGVDTSIKEVGYLPNGATVPSAPNASTGERHSGPSGNGDWKCSDKQKALILKVVDDHKLDKN